jgi:hypothetical protein
LHSNIERASLSDVTATTFVWGLAVLVNAQSVHFQFQLLHKLSIAVISVLQSEGKFGEWEVSRHQASSYDVAYIILHSM